jgi:hypothetical protein
MAKTHSTRAPRAHAARLVPSNARVAARLPLLADTTTPGRSRRPLLPDLALDVGRDVLAVLIPERAPRFESPPASLGRIKDRGWLTRRLLEVTVAVAVARVGLGIEGAGLLGWLRRLIRAVIALAVTITSTVPRTYHRGIHARHGLEVTLGGDVTPEAIITIGPLGHRAFG